MAKRKTRAQAGRQAGVGPSPGEDESRDPGRWPHDLEDAIRKALADGHVTVAWEAGKDLAAAIPELTIPAEVARDHVAATLRSLGPRVAAAGLDDERRLPDEEISGALTQAPSLDELASIFERLAYKAVYAALVGEMRQRNAAAYREIARGRRGDPESIDGVLQTAAAALLRECRDPDPSKDLDAELRRRVSNEARTRARQDWRRAGKMAPADEGPPDEAIASPPDQEWALTSKEHLAMLPTDEHRLVLELWRAGYSEEEIAEALGVSVRTVQRRKQDIRRILGPELLP